LLPKKMSFGLQLFFLSLSLSLALTGLHWEKETSQVEETQWPCVYTDNASGLVYNLTSQSDNTKNPINGLYKTTDKYGDTQYFFKLCDPTTNVPGESPGTHCKRETQVCQLDEAFCDESCGFDYQDTSCGVGPPMVTFYSNQSGLVMHTKDGDEGCGTTRSSEIHLLCPSEHGRQNNDIDYAIEYAPCKYRITLFINDACGTAAELCCTYTNNSNENTTSFAICSHSCPVVSGFPMTHSAPISDCDKCVAYNPEILDCCLYENMNGFVINNCTTNGVCPPVSGYVLISQYPTDSCDACMINSF